MSNVALIIAGGVGARTRQDIPKQFIHVENKPIIIYTLEAFQNCSEIDEIYVVCLEGWEGMLKAYAAQFGIDKLFGIVKGGQNGQDSIRNGITELSKRHHNPEDVVLVHDAIRPFVNNEIIIDSINVCRKYGNAIASVPCNTAVLKSDDGKKSVMQENRDYLKMTQTPQAFFVKDLLEAHNEALRRGITSSIASCTMYIELGRELYLSMGSEKNIKITTLGDIEIFKAMLLTKNEDWVK